MTKNMDDTGTRSTKTGLAGRIGTALLSAAVTMAAGLAIRKAWTWTTGEEPPDPEDPGVPVRRAITWFIASGLGVGLSQLLFSRTVARRRQERATRDD